ncbi:VOC family protein [Brachybacterium sp. AOP42-C2-15]|uniref:VOC family protein n=1 Tax=unclassified Brachybacterium TaxID=2623841 RepID=UPI003F9261DD
MSVFVSHTSIDCHDAYALSEWWRRILDYGTDPEDPNLPGHEECAIFDPDTGHTLLFLEVPDAELPAKRIHFDVRPRERTQEQEIRWLEEQGATLVADHRGQYGPGTGWLTMADPEGNQFCVLKSPAERAAATASPSAD